jgi:galactofuranosylgalactofuranosylrhamnosyl-N-acetylglucosaminyl-diphospho-decaprenol beta-1,5/1,6-galactofuranosyltransferase
VHRIRKEYPDAVVLPGADELPAPSRRNRQMRPPVHPVAIGYRLARGALHNLTKADPEHHRRPQLNIPTQDARWFKLCTLDGATVTTADGRGVVYRKRDRAKMFGLLWQSLRRQRKLASRFDEMRRVYREALPVLSSKQKWESVLLAVEGHD